MRSENIHVAKHGSMYVATYNFF